MQQRVRVSLFLPLMAGLSLILAGCSDASDGAAQEQQQQQSITVGVVTIEPATVDVTTVLPGRVSAFKVAEVRPQVSGILQSQLFKEGSVVEAGQQLYQIEPGVYQAEVASAQAAVARAKALIKSTEARFNRFQQLLKENAISQQDYDEAEAAYLQAEAEYKVAQADLNRAELNLRYTRVEAPISGRISRSVLTEGALVTTGQAQPLTYIHQLDPIYVDIAQSSEEYAELQRDIRTGRITTDKNNQAAVTLTVGKGFNFAQTGKLLFNEVTVDPQTSSITLRAQFANPDHVLMPGMYVRAEVARGELQQALLVPQQGVTRDPRGRATAMFVNQDGVVEQRYLTVDRTIGSDWLVTDGVTAGDQVIIEGLQKIKPGDTVTTEEVK
ncbi:hemolysin D [Pseudidiomarina salinarum]|uniref:Hemolysin D n=1 Tax=Pseudidiomarina salinarum TaxID=435908 RepID=A0A094LAQ1_9GAMM|nr:efflux RND transporter periplasmic adaptor subunit [Pseudidiomarina salinarum]KFZ31923.1 hemolysin D [Pseudidiomarina salinarum]RUO70303.1 efflux RND transporter periplasmic adaptor subunit [Pseudidiomarina salinarum]